MWPFSKKFSSITTQELQDKLSHSKVSLRLIDVRTLNEYREGHIKQAKNHPLDQIQSYKASKDNPIYVICQSGMRSRRAAAYLQKQGFNVVNVSGGMSAWRGLTVKGK